MLLSPPTKFYRKPSVGATLAVARPTAHLVPVRRGRRLPTVVPTDSRPLLWPPIGALPRNQLASSATGGASPISPTPRFTAPLVTPPPGLAPRPMKNHVIAKPVRTLAVAIRTPRPPQPPYLKGLARRSRDWGILFPHPMHASVGADAYIGPPYQPPSCP